MHFENGASLTREDTRQMMRLSHAMTYASVQGRETDGTLCLHDCNAPHFTLEHLYVALSRVRRLKNVRSIGLNKDIRKIMEKGAA